MRKYILIAVLLLCIGAGSLTCASCSERTVELIIPSIEEVTKNGYPINEYGETYGPDVKNMDVQPDLILATNADGITGYIRQSELNPEITLAEALNKEPCESVYMYSQDGKTIVGKFDLS